MNTRVVDTNEYVSALRELAEEGRVVSMLIAGSSMSPFLCHNRDYIYFTRPDRELRRGDMVFYQRDTGTVFIRRKRTVTIWRGTPRRRSKDLCAGIRSLHGLLR